MGLYQNIYIGPYVTGTPKTITKINEETKCDNNHKAKKGQNFCSKCGAAVKTVEVPFETKLYFYQFDNWSELEPFFVPAIYNDEYEILVSNQRGVGKYLDDNEAVIDIGSYDSDDEIENFKVINKEAIAGLQQHYEHLEVGYGVIIWYE